MATITEKDFGSVNTTTNGDTTLYTVPGSTRAIVRTWRVTNKHATDTVIVKALRGTLQYDIAALAPGYMAEFCLDGAVLELPAAAVLKINCVGSAGEVDADVILTGVEVT